MSKAIESTWFSGPRGCFGFLVAENDRGERELLAGVAGGADQEADEQHILDYGSKVTISLMEGMIAKVKAGR